MTGIVKLRVADRDFALAAIKQNPAVNVFVNHRLQNPPANRLVDGDLVCSVDETPKFLYVGGNAVPVNLTGTDLAEIREIVNWLIQNRPPVGSLVGEASAVHQIWQELEPFWPYPARLIRKSQPYLINTKRFSAEVKRVRYANIADLSQYYAAAENMFIGEVDLVPPRVAFQQRVAENLRAENSIGWFSTEGEVLFKLDIGAMADGWMQIQGVWLHPELRNQGVSEGLIAEAFSLIQRRFDVNFCLYVNDFNLPALRAYQKLGFAEIAKFATVFF